MGAPTMMERAAVDIVDCLDADLDPSVFGYSAEEGAHSLEIILAIHASHARHGSERCPPRIRASSLLGSELSLSVTHGDVYMCCAGFVSLPLEAADRAHVLRSG